jgi:hypothetical protein
MELQCQDDCLGRVDCLGRNPGDDQIDSCLSLTVAAHRALVAGL